MRVVLLTFVLVASTMCFTFQPLKGVNINVDSSVEMIPYPWIDCGDRPWSVDSFTLDQIPKRNINDTIKVVLLSPFRLELWPKQWTTRELILLLNSMELCWTNKLSILLRTTMREMSSSSHSWALFLLSLPAETTSWPSLLLTPMKRTKDVLDSHSNSDVG